MLQGIRGGNKRELLRNSQRLSAYIRHTITNKKASIWIAQRPGRTKTAYEMTEAGLLKMFNMSAKGNFFDSFSELNIVPLVVSYEYEPCCAFKIKESVIALNGPYQKNPDEDLMSILTGITQPKGRIHMSIGKPVNQFLKLADQEDNLNNKINKLTELIDTEVYSHYKCWPNNYIAFDLLQNSQEFKAYYTSEEKKSFIAYMENELKGFEGDRKIPMDLFLKIYANPVTNINRCK